ncbi:MAG: tetratricopeptide repeat protein [Acetobacteraceae bacterium]
MADAGPTRIVLTDPGLRDSPLFQQCLAALRAGDLAGADRLVETLLDERPNSADVWHLRGTIAARRGRGEQAAALFDAALARAPDSVAILFDSGVSLGRLERHEAALERLARAIALQPDHIAALTNHGNALNALGRHAEALRSFDRALNLDPARVEALHGRGRALAALKRPEEAIEGYNRALAVAPRLLDALLGKGDVLLALERFAEALDCFERAVAVASDPAGAVPAEQKAHAQFFRGDALRCLERFDDALTAYDEALAIKPDYVEAWMGRGRVLDELREFEEALAAYDQALALRPDDAKAHDYRSRVLRDLNRLDESMAAVERALALDPNDSGALNSKATLLRALGRIDEALDCYRLAVAASANPGPIRFNHSLCLLIAGDFERGWPEYEYRWTTENLSKRKPQFMQRLWLGQEDIAGLRVLLHTEQGFGDTIQFCRYATLVAARGATVILGVQPSLRPLMMSLEGPADVVDRMEAMPVFDMHSPLLSLPLAFRTTRATIPARVPYLAAPAGHQALWQDRLGPRQGPRIGLVWSGSATHQNDQNRSLALDMLRPILSSGQRFHCLQRELRPADVPGFAMSGNIIFHGHELLDFSDTAALIMQMDLVITVDTSVAHLAGALGRPVWVMLAFAPDWRWMRTGDTSPWYPTMRLFRQSRPNDWQPVIARVGAALRTFLAEHGA